ncbi:hypothetical protein HUG15_06415 [Salicibibacter cibarius]|uniref:Uncharacterized protein n=1 Tax=Salicibibacter cibarius TaxID=2743000 RepID=A0A7T7CAU2_9BACI|nr:hypothetical protein [Salicibibacter cibarius]QQK75257.1 hypothetical protein HUG15_06415 [Salicibibacter cibarius]
MLRKHSKKYVLLIVLILPWLTVPLLGSKAFKRFLPAAIFICTFTKAIDIFGQNKKWWTFYKGIHSFDSMNFFNFGPYLVTSLWVLKMTYGNLPLYFISNTILHICFIYFGGLRIVKHFKIFSLVKLTRFQYLLIDVLRGLLLYGFQYMTELKECVHSDRSGN